MKFLWEVTAEWWLGLRHNWRWVRHPWLSARAIYCARHTFETVRRRLEELNTGGVVILTPHDAPVLCSRISGFGDVTVQIEPRKVLSAATLADHHRQVRESLKPFDDLSALGNLLLGFVASLPILVGLLVSCLRDTTILVQTLLPVLLGTLSSAILTVSVRRGLRRLALSAFRKV